MTNQHTQAMLDSEWFTVVDDLIGGWAVATVNKPLSEIDVRELGVYVVAEMISEHMADYIVYLHERQRLS